MLACCTAKLIVWAQINTVDIDKAGSIFVSGGNDRLVKVFSYDEGELVAVGTGHSGAVTRAKISPDGKTVVSVGTEGAIFVWSL